LSNENQISLEVQKTKTFDLLSETYGEDTIVIWIALM